MYIAVIHQVWIDATAPVKGSDTNVGWIRRAFCVVIHQVKWLPACAGMTKYIANKTQQALAGSGRLLGLQQ